MIIVSWYERESGAFNFIYTRNRERVSFRRVHRTLLEIATDLWIISLTDVPINEYVYVRYTCISDDIIREPTIQMTTTVSRTDTVHTVFAFRFVTKRDIDNDQSINQV